MGRGRVHAGLMRGHGGHVHDRPLLAARTLVLGMAERGADQWAHSLLSHLTDSETDTPYTEH